MEISVQVLPKLGLWAAEIGRCPKTDLIRSFLTPLSRGNFSPYLDAHRHRVTNNKSFLCTVYVELVLKDELT